MVYHYNELNSSVIILKEGVGKVKGQPMKWFIFWNTVNDSGKKQDIVTILK